MADDRNRTLTQQVKAYSSRLLGFIRKRISSEEDAEDILQDVFFQFAGNAEPIEQVSSWLYAVARNKITDRYRRQELPSIDSMPSSAEDEEGFDWKELVPSNTDTPEMTYLRNLFWEELQLALDELPAEQRDAFIQHEMEGRSFKELSEAWQVSVPTLISRKRYAVVFLRGRLEDMRRELMEY